MSNRPKLSLEALRLRMEVGSERYRQVSQRLVQTSTQFAVQCLLARKRTAQLRATCDWYREQAGTAARLHPIVVIETADAFPEIEQALSEILRPIREQCRNL